MSLRDEEAELSVLGAMISDNTVTDVVSTIVHASDFGPETGKIYSAFLRMRAGGEKFTHRTVPSGSEELALKCSGSRHQVRSFAERVARATKRRQLQELAADLARDCAVTTETSDTAAVQWFRSWQENLVTATTIATRTKSARMADVCTEFLAQVEQNKQQRGVLRGVSTGIETFDEVTRGLRKSDTHIIAARAGMGKTALMVNVLRGAASSGARTLVYSYEMRPSMLVQRMFTAASRVLSARIDSGEVTDDDNRRLAEAGSELMQLPIWFEERGTISDIRAAAIEQHRTQGLDLLVIDHVGLVESIGNKPSREREVAEISRGLKAIATALDIPVLILAQLNRNADPTMEPGLSELRESGSLEQDASVVFLLWATPDNETANEVQWKIAKNRHGPAGRKGTLAFYRATQLITERTTSAPKQQPRTTRESLTDEAARLAKWDQL